MKRQSWTRKTNAASKLCNLLSQIKFKQSLLELWRWNATHTI